MSTMERAREFLERRRLALVGVSRDEKGFSRMVQRELLKRGYDVVPINPAAAGAELDGRRAFGRLQEVSPPVDGAIFFTAPEQTAAAVREALAAGVRRLWFHRGGGAGASSPEALAECRAAGVEPITCLCPFMAWPDAGWFHRLHGFLRGAGAGKVTALVALLGLLAGCATSTTERRRLRPLRTVERVELGRYLGTWYEIASFPQRFQRGCTATTETYTARDDGQIDVLNRCRKDSLDGEEKSARGRARVVDPVSNARLEVSFFRPFWGDYWIIDLDADYQFAVVGHPNRDYLWILSRAAALPEATYQAILSRLEAQGYETERLVRTLQPTEAGQARAPRTP